MLKCCLVGYLVSRQISIARRNKGKRIHIEFASTGADFSRKTVVKALKVITKIIRGVYVIAF